MGSYTGPRGTVVIGGGHAGSVTGPQGGTIGGAGGHAVVIGPNGNVHAGGGHAGAAVTPGGRAIAGGSRGGVTVGPGGATASGSRGGIATGPGGTIAGGQRGAVAVGPQGTHAAGRSFAAGHSNHTGRTVAGTRYVSRTTLAGQGTTIRGGFRYYDSFSPEWYTRHPGAWYTAGLVAGSLWTAATWGNAAPYVGYGADVAPVDYDYGNTVTYQDGNVYYDGEQYATAADYTEQAAQIATTGKDAEPAENDKWQPLGVFAMVQGDETSSNDIFQLAVNADGVVRGNYYNALTDQTTPLTGALDKDSQRVAWRVGDGQFPVYETGFYNLTQEQTTLLVHQTADQTAQYRLFRIEQSQDGQTGQAGANPTP